MNFQGIHNYSNFQYYTFPEIPNFKKQKQKYEYDPRYFGNLVYQLNIAQILQWVEYIEKMSSVMLSEKLYHLQYDKKDEENVYIMAKNKLNLVQYFGNTGLIFLKKICKQCSEYTSIYNEYYVTIYALNYLREKTPTFNFTYSFHDDRRFLSLKQEYSKGESLGSFFKTCSMDDFYNVFFQIILSLEISQRHLLFTHYDLNNENILVIKVDEPFIMKLGKVDYSFEKYQIRIIDFGFSSVSTNQTDVFSNCSHHLYHYGYFPFFTPGTDMFRVIGHILSECKDLKQKFGYFLVHQMYQLKCEKLEQSIKQVKQSFFNCSYSPILYTIPLECITFLESLPIEEFAKFKIETIPYQKRMTRRTDEGTMENRFKNIFSLGSIAKHDQYKVLNKMYVGKNQGEPPCRIPKSYPLFLMEPTEVIQKFVRTYGKFLEWFSPKSENVSHHQCFRVLSCLHQFLYFQQNPSFQFNPQSQKELKQSVKSLVPILTCYR